MTVVRDGCCYSLPSSRATDSSSAFRVAAAAVAVAAGTVGNHLRPAKFSAQRTAAVKEPSYSD
jgi:hypothetical protein